jgi:hypothetical protein
VIRSPIDHVDNYSGDDYPRNNNNFTRESVYNQEVESRLLHRLSGYKSPILRETVSSSKMNMIENGNDFNYLRRGVHNLNENCAHRYLVSMRESGKIAESPCYLV